MRFINYIKKITKVIYHRLSYTPNGVEIYKGMKTITFDDWIIPTIQDGEIIDIKYILIKGRALAIKFIKIPFTSYQQEYNQKDLPHIMARTRA